MMEETQRILLNGSRNKSSRNENTSMNVSLSGNKKLLPEEGIIDYLDAYDIYLDERKKSNKFRLIFDINPYCTNVLFNPFTEIIKNEGSTDVSFFNYSGDVTTSTLESDVVGEGSIIAKKPTFEWNQYQAIRDTQLSSDKCDYVYHCGIDVFNNHILRSKSFKPINYDKINSKKSGGTLDLFLPSPENLAYTDVKVNNTKTSHVYIDDYFNTIDDYMRDRNGIIISEHFPKIVEKDAVTRNLDNIVMPLHLYQEYDIRSFEECVEDKLIEQNGWYGFINPSTIASITKEDESRMEMGINKTINNRLYCDFIDMYPGKELYSFTPRYNSYKQRLEKNWNYCLTYPSKSVIRNGDVDFPFFLIDESGHTSLKSYMIDEGTVSDDGIAMLTVYSICQHGLQVGDTVNIYKRIEIDGRDFDELYYNSVEVSKVVDKYIFQVVKNDGNMSEMWVEVKNRNIEIEIDSETRVNSDDKILFGMYLTGGHYYPICESNRCNIDPNAQNIHFRRVVNGVECEYYVRKFSRLPNFKFKDEEVNGYTLYDDNFINSKKKGRNGSGNLTLIQRFSKPGNPNDRNIRKNWPVEFESHIGKLGFTNTPYSDDASEIVFTDDVDLSYLRDNLGRPLSDIYLTIVKNNMGYKEWYGIDGTPIDIKTDTIEYSRCFGKINSSFLLSEYYRESYNNAPINATLYDVRDITANNSQINALHTQTDEYHNYYNMDKPIADEVEFYRDWEYYGDICCYSPVDCDEQSIQMSMQRFNTAQRELTNDDGSYIRFNSGVMYHDEIRDTENNLPFDKTNNGDPYTKFENGWKNPRKASEVVESNLYHTTREEYSAMTEFKEGYYYQPHYRIMAKMVSKSLSSDTAITYEITRVAEVDKTPENRQLFELKTNIENDFLKNDKLVMYKKSTNEYFFITVYDLITSYRFTCVIADELGNHVDEIEGFTDIENIDDYVLLKKREGIPSYARLIKDGSCRYYWREIVSNGIENVGEKIYPFTNGAFYITKQINFFLRRQDPNKENLGLFIGDGAYDYIPLGENRYKYYKSSFDTGYDEYEMDDCLTWKDVLLDQ